MAPRHPPPGRPHCVAWKKSLTSCCLAAATSTFNFGAMHRPPGRCPGFWRGCLDARRDDVAVKHMVGQILLQVIFVVHLQDMPHLIQRNLRQFHLAHHGVSQADGHGNIFGWAAQRFGNGMKMVAQLFGRNFFVEDGRVQQGIPRERENSPRRSSKTALVVRLPKSTEMIWARFFLEVPFKNGGSKAMCLSYKFVCAKCKLLFSAFLDQQLLRQTGASSSFFMCRQMTKSVVET